MVGARSESEDRVGCVRMLWEAFYLRPAFMRFSYELGGESAVAVREAESGHFPYQIANVSHRGLPVTREI